MSAWVLCVMLNYKDLTSPGVCFAPETRDQCERHLLSWLDVAQAWAVRSHGNITGPLAACAIEGLHT